MKILSNSLFVYLVKRTWQHAGDQRPRMVMVYAMFIVANFCMAMQPIVLAHIINTIQDNNADAIRHALSWAAVYAGIVLIFWIFQVPARIIERRLGFKVFETFVAQLYRMVTEMPLRWHQDHHSGDTINRINKAGRALFNFAQEQFAVIQMAVRFTTSMVVLGLYSPWVLAASFSVSLLIMAVIRHYDGILIPLIGKENEREHALNASLFDYISNIITILTLRVQDNTRAEVSERLTAMKPPFWREIVVNEYKWSLVNIMLVMTQAGVVGAYIAIHLWRHQTPQVGSVVAIFQYLLMISMVFYDAASVYGRLMQRSTDMHGVDDLIESHARLARSAAPRARTWKQIAIEGLSFTHHEGEDALQHLLEVDITINAGQKIALIGSSGSGKTTLLTLLRGLYDAASVKLKIDGEAFDTLLPLSGFTTLVPQDSEIFENTVFYNLTLDTVVPDEIVQQALSITTFDDVAPKLPKGLMTDIRERGVNLSGGQKQRLALARGLIAARDSSLLLLDEPTSSVDLATEATIFDRLLTAFKDKTIVASVHRLHLLPRFDFIGLMKDGVIVEQGSFNDLLAQQGEFHRIWQHHLAQSNVREISEQEV